MKRIFSLFRINSEPIGALQGSAAIEFAEATIVNMRNIKERWILFRFTHDLLVSYPETHQHKFMEGICREDSSMHRPSYTHYCAVAVSSSRSSYLNIVCIPSTRTAAPFSTTGSYRHLLNAASDAASKSGSGVQLSGA